MSKKVGYLIALGAFALGGALGAIGGGYVTFQSGYNKGRNEPEVLVLNYETHGIEGICVRRNANELVCAADVDYNGSVDVVVVDIETQEIKEVLPGKDDCIDKYLRDLEEIQQEQKPKQ